MQYFLPLSDLNTAGREGDSILHSAAAAFGFIGSRVVRGTEFVADEAGSWNDLHARHTMKRIDHQAAYSPGGVYTNGAKEFVWQRENGIARDSSAS